MTTAIVVWVRCNGFGGRQTQASPKDFRYTGAKKRRKLCEASLEVFIQWDVETGLMQANSDFTLTLPVHMCLIKQKSYNNNTLLYNII